MEYTPEIFETVAESVKKTWNKPMFEIISKEVIQGGSVAGNEGTITGAGSSAVSHFS